MYTLRERDFDAFFAVPAHAYGPGSTYVSPMRSDLGRILDGAGNPAFGDPDALTWFTVSRAGVPVGRITAQVHRKGNARHGSRTGYFGFFDCADDPAPAALLLDAAAEWLGRRGCDEMAGNFNLTATQQIGVVTEGFENAPFTDQHYNPAHVPGLLEGAGLEPFFPMSTFELDLTAFDPASLLGPRQEALLAEGRLSVEPLRRRRFGAQLETCRALLNASFARNPMFVPLSREEFLFHAQEMMWILDERLSSIWSLDGEPVAVMVCIPDLNPFLRATGSRLRPSTPLHFLRARLRRRRAIAIFGGVDTATQGRGLAAVVLHHTLAALKRAGYERFATTWVADDNPTSLRQMEKMGARRLHRLHLFRRPL